MEKKQIMRTYLREFFLLLALTSAGYKIVEDREINTNQREAYEKNIEQKEGALKQIEEKLKKYEEEGIRHRKALENYYPPISKLDLLDKQDKKDLGALLSLNLPSEVANKRLRNNTCSYQNEFGGKLEGGSGTSYAGCVLLTEDLVLTNYHVVHVDYFRDFFPIKSTVTTPDGLEVIVKELIAISPLYDLALVRLKEPVASILPIPVGQAQKEAPFSYASLYHKKGQEELSLDEGILEVVEEIPFRLNAKGGVSPPSLVMHASQGRELTYGDSGCPILQNGKIVGLFFAHRESDRLYITYVVSAFLSEVISD